MQTITIFGRKQSSLSLFINRTTYELFTHKSYPYKHLTVCKQIGSGSYKNVIYKLFVYKLYIQYMYKKSSCLTIRPDLPDPLPPPPLSIVHRFRVVSKATSCIGTELLYIGSSWSSCFCSSMCWGPQEYIIYEFVPTSPAVSRMSSSSNLHNFPDGW